jgi:prevent-host-death family protein
MTMTVTEARARMREALERVKAGEEVELSQNGQVIAVLVHPDKLRPRVRTANTVAAEALLHSLERTRNQRVTASLSAESAQDLVSEVRRQRDEDWE